MRKLFLALAAVAALAFAGQAGAASNATKTINIYGSGFSPSSATITEGDTVTWVNRDNANHQVLATKGAFVSPILKPKQTFSFTFKAAGTYTYSDELNSKHTAKIVVKGLPPTVTLAISAPIVTYGTQATLSGVVSNHAAGEQVAIYYKPYPQPNLIQRTTVLTATGGTFSFIVAPQILTTYEAAWKGAFSDADHGAGGAEADARPQQRLDHPCGGRALVCRACRPVPASQFRHRPVGDAQEGAPELAVVGAGALRAAEGHEPPARDDVRQPGRCRLSRRDQSDRQLADDLRARARRAQVHLARASS